MDARPHVSDADLAATPPAVRTLLVWQSEQIASLTARLVELEDKLARLQGKTPANSSKPPSSTHPHDKPPPKDSDKDKPKRKRGGQPGHDKHERPLIPSAECARVVEVLPGECRKCGKALAGIDPAPIRHQVWELPEIKPIVTEYQQHRLVCSCGCSTCGKLPEGVPTGQAGPRLIAFAAVLMACFRQSKRRAALFMSTILNQPASPAWMVKLQNLAAEAVKPAYDELAEQLPRQETLNIDESPTKQATSKAWVWTFVAAGFTFFACRTCRTSRAADILKELLGQAYDGIVGCDRARMYWCLGPGGMGRLQWCWAHLKRDFQALIDGPCHTRKRLGHDLMRLTKQMFALWQKVRDGTLSHRAFRRRMKPIRAKIDALLLRGYFNARTCGFCKELVDHKAHLWTFVDIAGIEPTNNAAERALRHAVIWRKLSFGTQSAKGSRFVERLLTVVETCRRQNRNAFAWLADAVASHIENRLTTSLLPAA